MRPLKSDTGRVTRVMIWIPAVTLLPATLLALAGRWGAAAGIAAGGAIVLVNLIGTQRTVSLMVSGNAAQRTMAILVWFGKLGLTVAAILVLLSLDTVGTVALLAGIGSLPMSLVFDIFLFPVNKGGAKKP